MNEPIKAGDLAEVIDGLEGKASPNLGLVVRVLSYMGDHSKHGRIWRCEAEYAVLGQPGGKIDSEGTFLPGSGITPGIADFAQYWLRKINPPVPKEAANDQIAAYDCTVTVEDQRYG